MELNAQDVRPEDIPKLPSRMRDLVRLIGIPAAVDFINKFGGREVSFPKHENANKAGAASFSLLARVVGRENALILCTEYGGERLPIPRCHSWRYEMRARDIRRAFDAGASIPDLVSEHGLTSRAIEIILNRAV